jgi:hypothetical protein
MNHSKKIFENGMHEIYKSRYKNIECLVLESDKLIVKIIPESGGKIQSIFHKKLQKEYLYQSGENEFKKSSYDSVFSKGDMSGFDEVFPSIDECYYPHFPWKGIKIPDHGEIWPLNWDYKLNSDSIVMCINGIRFPYRFEKRIELIRDNCFKMSYNVSNPSDFDFHFIWCPHPFFVCGKNTVIKFPESVRRVISTSTVKNKLGDYGTVHSWPITGIDGQEYDISKIYPKYENKCEKYYAVERMVDGWCALRDDTNGETIGLSFPVEKVPYLGVWEGIIDEQYITALEPCTGAMDRLDVAVLQKKDCIVKAKGRYDWHLNITIDVSDRFNFIDENGCIN